VLQPRSASVLDEIPQPFDLLVLQQRPNMGGKLSGSALPALVPAAFEIQRTHPRIVNRTRGYYTIYARFAHNKLLVGFVDKSVYISNIGQFPDRDYSL
jgi:hypothetical protein